jgi:hypothetical protein
MVMRARSRRSDNRIPEAERNDGGTRFKSETQKKKQNDGSSSKQAARPLCAVYYYFLHFLVDILVDALSLSSLYMYLDRSTPTFMQTLRYPKLLFSSPYNPKIFSPLCIAPYPLPHPSRGLGDRGGPDVEAPLCKRLLEGIGVQHTSMPGPILTPAAALLPLLLAPRAAIHGPVRGRMPVDLALVAVGGRGPPAAATIVTGVAAMGSPRSRPHEASPGSGGAASAWTCMGGV